MAPRKESHSGGTACVSNVDWQRRNNDDSDNAAIPRYYPALVTTDSAVIAMTIESALFTLVWQQCAHHCESSGNCQRCHSTVSWYRCHTNVHIVISALSVGIAVTQMCTSLSQSVGIAVTPMCTSLSQHCHYHCCPSAVTVNAVTLLSAWMLKCEYG